jgi:hypothetical protein
MARRNNNPKNPQSQLFQRLTRLFSGPIVNYRQQNIRRYRRRSLDKFNFTSASGQQFKKSSYNPFSPIQTDLMNNQDRAMRYVDFDQMEYTPEIASALDIYADEMTTSSDLKPLLSIACPNEEIKAMLNTLYLQTLNLEHNLFGWCRTTCKYGDMFMYLDIDETLGIRSAIALPTAEVERIEGQDPTNPNYVQYQWNSGGLTLESWQTAHFRVLGNDKFAPYGTSVLEPARRIWRQLTLLEDAMMAYRIVRAPERRVFYVDTGNIAPQDVEQYMQKIMTSMKRNQIVNDATGRVDLRYNPMSVEEDYFIPVRGGTSTKIENLPGGTYQGDIDDVKYLRDKLFSALKVPQSYLSSDENASEDKTTLAQKDIRFARTIQRLQRVIVAELEKIGIIHLYTLGYRGDDLVSFRIALNNPSKIAEMQELEHWKTKFDAASSATEGFFSKRWIAKKLFSMTDEEFLRNQREMFFDRRFEAQLEAEAEAVAAAGGGGGDLGLGGDEGGDLGLGGDEGGDLDLGGDDGDGDADLGGEEAAEDDGGLLAEPAKRRDDIGGDIVTTRTGKKAYKPKGSKGYVTSRSKGKEYVPRASPSYGASARKRSIAGATHGELAKNTPRNVFKGASELSSVANMTYENKEPNYLEEESKIFETKREVRDLITELELRTNVEKNKAQ